MSSFRSRCRRVRDRAARSLRGTLRDLVVSVSLLTIHRASPADRFVQADRFVADGRQDRAEASRRSGPRDWLRELRRRLHQRFEDTRRGPSREPPHPAGLLATALYSAAGALAGLFGGPLGAGFAGTFAVFATVRARALVPAACALPAALGAVETPTTERSVAGLPEVAGPVRVDVRVVDRPRVVLERAEARFRVALPGMPGRAAIQVVAHTATHHARDLPLPGDRLVGPGYLGDPTTAHHAGYLPILRLDLRCCHTHRGPTTLRRLTERLRRHLEDALRELVPGSRGVLLCHLVLGAGPAPDPQLVDDHRATGLAHLLAVSGAHLSLLAGLLASLGKFWSGGRDPSSGRGYRRLAAAILLPYALLTGLEPPVLRALLAWSVLMFARVHGRRIGVVAALALPALVTSACWPRDLLGASFQLSYAAVLGLWAAGVLETTGSLASLRRATHASVWATLTTAPITLLWFGQIAPWTIVATPLLGPLVAIMLGAGLIAATFAPWLRAAAEPPAWLAGTCAELYTDAVHELATWPGTPVPATWQPPVAVLVGTALLAATVLWLWPSRRTLAAAALLTCLPWFVPGPCEQQVPGLTLLDVGHGQAALAILDRGECVVLDCGARLHPERAAGQLLDAFPDGPRTVDLLVVSHEDSDHAGGVAALCRALTVRHAVLPRTASGGPAAHALARAGAQLSWIDPGDTLRPLPGVEITAPRLPRSNANTSRNERSLWTRLQWDGGTSVLAPGDAEATALEVMAGAEIARPATALILPHHGRGGAAESRALATLLERTRPEVALVSRGASPEPPPLGAVLRARGIPVHDTSLRGALHLRARSGDRPALLTGARPTLLTR